jgi:cytochrome P450
MVMIAAGIYYPLHTCCTRQLYHMLIRIGTDTSSVAISAFFFYHSRHPNAYTKLAIEIRDSFANAEETYPGQKLNNCTYLRACIDESMRMSPPVGAPLWREMRNKDEIAGVILPKGTNVATCIFSIHRNPAYFTDPNEIRPDRWLEEFQGDSQANLAKRAFVPFPWALVVALVKTSRIWR